jgi:bifunctional enzyme CysN/CysC
LLRIVAGSQLTWEGEAGTVWLTGLPAAGKSSIAAELVRVFRVGRTPAHMIDGDELRRGLCGDLGYDDASRRENVRRAGELALMLAHAGTVAVAALISPHADARAAVRARHVDEGLPFLEVFVDTPPAVCRERDPKGLYRRAAAGQIEGLTGFDAPYEPPQTPDVVLDTSELSIAQSVEIVQRRWSAVAGPHCGRGGSRPSRAHLAFQPS